MIDSFNSTKINSSLGKKQTCRSTLETQGMSIFSVVRTLHISPLFVFLFIANLIFHTKWETMNTSVLMSLIKKETTTWKGLTFSLLILKTRGIYNVPSLGPLVVRFFFYYFIFKLYIIVLVLPYIKMNPLQVYMCSPSWTLLGLWIRVAVFKPWWQYESYLSWFT